MPTIFTSKTSKIEKTGNMYKLIYENGENYSNFFEKIKKNLEIKKEEKGNYFTFQAVKVEPLKTLLKRKEGLSYRHLKELFTQIGKQFEGLEEDGYCNLFLEIEDIVRVEVDRFTQHGGSGADIYFLYLNTTEFLPIKDKITKITKPISKKNLFFSPELKKLKSFPKEIHMNSQLYSLALLVCYCGEWNKNKKVFKNIKHELDTFREYLSNIENTKLYWSLLRCLQYNPRHRIYLYI